MIDGLLYTCPRATDEAIVVPFVNEAAGVERFYEVIAAIASRLPAIESKSSACTTVPRTTLAPRSIWSKRESRVCAIELSRNSRKKAALSAGIDAAVGDAGLYRCRS